MGLNSNTCIVEFISNLHNIILIQFFNIELKKDVCETLLPPFPNIMRIVLTFDLELSPTDVNINRGHLPMKDHLPTKFEAYRATHDS